jgi:predicted chitinase
MRLNDLFEDTSPRERFEQSPPATGKLVIFDIDDTLVNTTTKVGVRRDGKLVKQLNSHDFTHYELQPGEEFDFGGFRDAREFFTQARPIPGMIGQLKQDIESGNKVIMLTARSDFNDRDVFLDTFRQYGIDMDRIHVYRAGNLVTKAATEEKKKIILKHLLGKHAYEKVIMYDDSVPNLNAFLSLKQDFPYTEFYAWHVDPSGRADEYHRTGLDENTQITEISRRGFLAGLAGFAAVSAMPPSLVSALSTPEGIQSMSVSDVSALLKAIRAYLPPYDQEDWTGTFERWDKMADALRIPDGDLDAADKLDRLMRQYRRDPEAASAKLLRHLQRHAVDLTDVQGQTISQWDDVATVSKSDPVNDEIRQMQQQIADYNARQRREKTPGIGQIQTGATAAATFRDLVQRVIIAGTTAAAAPPREKYMGRIEPTTSAPALPAPDRSAADIMAQLRKVVGRDLTQKERAVVAQEVGRTDTNEGLRDTLAGLALGAGVAMAGGAEAKPNVERMVVSPGQTVYSIAKAFDTTPQAIQRANRLDRNFSIRPGQTLVIPQPDVKIARPGAAPAAKPAPAKPAVKTAPPAKIRTLTGTTSEAIAKRLALQQGLKGLELAAFLAQIKHESWDFKRMHEVGDKRYFQRMYDKKYKPAKAKGLGNTEPGDGVRYRGRGYMQLTGRDNYRRVGRLLGVDLENNPELAARPDIAAQVALLYWKKRVRPKVRDWSNVAEVTRPINSRLAHLEDRKRDFAAYVDFYKLADQI